MAASHPADIAVIDVGSNSIRTMHAAVTPDGVAAFYKRLFTTRLAEGLDETGFLQDAPMDRTVAAIAAFVEQAGDLPLYAYGTSAVRDAKNRDAFLARVKRETGVTIDVLSGEEEARIAYLGAVGTRGGGMIDIGGGSAQVINEACRISFPIGCVRLRDAFSGLPFSAARPLIKSWLDARCGPALCEGSASRFTGVGGTITTLGALSLGLTGYDSNALSQARITPGGLEALILELDFMGEKRKKHPLLKERHDIILYGSAALAYLMERLKIHCLFVSDADGMEGYAAAMAKRA